MSAVLWVAALLGVDLCFHFERNPCPRSFDLSRCLACGDTVLEA